MRGEPKRKDSTIHVAEAIESTVKEFSSKWPDVEVTQQKYNSSVITILVKGAQMTREREDKIYEEILGHLKNKGFKVENAPGGPCGFEGSYGDEDYQEADSWKVTE